MINVVRFNNLLKHAFLTWRSTQSELTHCTKTWSNKQATAWHVIALGACVLEFNILHDIIFFFYHGTTATSGPRPVYYRGFKITLRQTTLGRTPLDEWSARHTELYLTTHNTHDRRSCPPVGFKPTTPASDWQQIHVIDLAEIRIGT
jgi:hypothetical protein